MKVPEKQLGVRIPATLYNNIQDNAKKIGVTFKDYVIKALNKAIDDISKDVGTNPHISNDDWVVAVNMGSFDLIAVQSPYLQKVQSYQEVCQHLYKDPLVIMRHSQVRKLVENSDLVELYTGASVKEPDPKNTPNKSNPQP